VSNKSSKLLIVLLSHCVVSAVHVTPTMSDCNRDVVACQPICFSSALIFAQLPRGPPQSALRKLLS